MDSTLPVIIHVQSGVVFVKYFSKVLGESISVLRLAYLGLSLAKQREMVAENQRGGRASAHSQDKSKNAKNS